MKVPNRKNTNDQGAADWKKKNRKKKDLLYMLLKIQ
jgi:hypothetical protein